MKEFSHRMQALVVGPNKCSNQSPKDGRKLRNAHFTGIHCSISPINEHGGGNYRKPLFPKDMAKMAASSTVQMFDELGMN